MGKGHKEVKTVNFLNKVCNRKKIEKAILEISNESTIYKKDKKVKFIRDFFNDISKSNQILKNFFWRRKIKIFYKSKKIT